MRKFVGPFLYSETEQKKIDVKSANFFQKYYTQIHSIILTCCVKMASCFFKSLISSSEVLPFLWFSLAFLILEVSSEIINCESSGYKTTQKTLFFKISILALIFCRFITFFFSFLHTFEIRTHTSCKILLNFCTYDLMEITSCISCKLTGSLLLFPPHWLHIVTDFWKKMRTKLYIFWFDLCGFWLV